jgi:hypothetical protein
MHATVWYYQRQVAPHVQHQQEQQEGGDDGGE